MNQFSISFITVSLLLLLISECVAAETTPKLSPWCASLLSDGVSDDGITLAAATEAAWKLHIVDYHRNYSNIDAPPPMQLPAELRDRYTRCGSVKTADYLVDDTRRGERVKIVVSVSELHHMITLSRKIRTMNAFQSIEQSRFVEALKKYTVRHKDVVVFGSTEPHIEAMVLSFNADSVTTIEYGPRDYQHADMFTAIPSEFAAHCDETVSVESISTDPEMPCQFDVAISLSSFDHDGLGRYGDPLAPDGDLLAMNEVYKMVKPGGYLIMSVPIGEDLVIWNLMRRYGRKRLPKLLQGWEVVERLGWEEERLDMDNNFRMSYEPLFVLRRPVGDVPESLLQEWTDTEFAFEQDMDTYSELEQLHSLARPLPAIPQKAVRVHRPQSDETESDANKGQDKEQVDTKQTQDRRNLHREL
jgi:SAM-dependent methyltransferase